MKTSVLIGLTVLVSAAGSAVTARAQTKLNAAGASFPAPIYNKWFEEFGKANSVQINYQPIGSGGGIHQLQAGTVDFGASDKPLSEADAKNMKGPVLHFPTVLGAVVPIYNIPGVTADLKFDGETLAGIFSGKIKKWNDPKIEALNSGVKFPDAEITVVHRSDGSGTTFVFTDFLSKTSPEWKSSIGANTSVNWPGGLGGPQNPGVAGLVKQNPHSIGYVELTYAVQNKLAYGLVKNESGKFLKATLAGVTAAAAAAAKSMPADFKVSITNAPGPAAYPISTYTWLLVPERIEDPAKRKAVTDFLHWMLAKGQGYCEGLDYAPLPKSVVALEESQIAKIK